MGLPEKRKLKELQDVTFPGRVKEIEEIVGVAIPYEVDWDSLADDAEALNFIDNLSCHRLNMALRGICIDTLAKEAVRDGLKLVKRVRGDPERLHEMARGMAETNEFLRTYPPVVEAIGQ